MDIHKVSLVESVSPSPAIPPPTASKKPLIFSVLLIIVAGAVSGFFLAKTGGSVKSGSAGTADTRIINTKTEAGSLDTQTFSDQAQGTLEVGGANGEGTHHLVRPGGVSQTVYLVSSVVDLAQFENKKVEVFGQTIRAKSVGWLMDVGRVKIIE